MATWNQWRIVAGMAAIYYDGIDHPSLAATMDMLGVKQSKRRDVFMHVRILESEAKQWRNEQE